MLVPILVGAHDEFERVEFVGELVDLDRLESVSEMTGLQLTLQSHQFGRQLRQTEEACVEEPIETRAVPAPESGFPRTFKSVPSMRSAIARRRIRNSLRSATWAANKTLMAVRATDLRADLVSALDAARVPRRRRREPGRVRVIDHGPQEVRRHAGAVVAAHAAELHTVLVERLHRQVRERGECARARERVVDAAVERGGNRVGLVALDARPLCEHEPVGPPGVASSNRL